MFENLAQQIATTFEPLHSAVYRSGPGQLYQLPISSKFAPYFVDGVLNTLAPVRCGGASGRHPRSGAGFDAAEQK